MYVKIDIDGVVIVTGNKKLEELVRADVKKEKAERMEMRLGHYGSGRPLYPLLHARLDS